MLRDKAQRLENAKPKIFSWLDTAKGFWYFLAEDRYKYLWYFILLLIIFFYDLVPIYLVGKMVDFFTSYQQGQPLTDFYSYVAIIGTTYIIASLIRLRSKYKLNVFSRHARARARIWGFERLTDFSLEWHSQENAGNKLQRIFTGAEALNRMSNVAGSDLLKIAANIIGVAFIFLFTDIKFLLIVVLYITVSLTIEFTISKKIFILSNEFNELNQSAGGTYVESANNMLSIKALGGEQAVIGRVSDKETLALDHSIKRANINNYKWRLFQYWNGASLAVFMLVTGLSFVAGQISLSMIFVFFTYFFTRLQLSINELTNLHSELLDLRSEIGQMMPIFKQTEFVKTGNHPFPKNWDKIEMKNICMEYGSGQTGLTNFNLKLNRNTKTGIAGLSGSGKSTLAKIILGLYGIKSGELRIGDEDYYSISHDETLSHVTVVLQETELFNLSLRDNITMMRGGNDDLLSMAVNISELQDVIARLPEGLDATIGEKGYMLSGGERQRLGIARAIYKNSPIILLDEATSSLDSETEGKIMEKLLGEYGKDKTFLIIAHRLGTLRYTDNIAVMERGEVKEEGSYDTLMSDQSSVFYRLNKEQKSNNESRK